MDWLTRLLWADGKFLGAEWGFWTSVGWMGNALFSSRFFVQWWATERQKRVVVPPIFWWLSMAGSGCLLAYGIHRRDYVFIFAYVFTWIPYIRNLIIGHRVRKGVAHCPACAGEGPPGAKFCPTCGAGLALASAAKV